MKRLAVGILAHVDAGKTTLSEAMLYAGGMIRHLGRVDKGDAFLDTYELEKKRGITIFSKQARLAWDDMDVTLLDTPGHVDFSAEMERVLQVLDYAVVIINALDGIQSHTETIWKLLQHYHVPALVFVNKLDVSHTERTQIMEDLKRHLTQSVDAGRVSHAQLFTGTAGSGALAVAAAVFSRLSAPEYLSAGQAAPETAAVGDALCIVFSPAVRHVSCVSWTDETGAPVYQLEAWTTLLDGGEPQAGRQSVTLPRQEGMIVFYAQNNGQDDALLYGTAADAGGRALPRLALNYYGAAAAVLAAVLALAALAVKPLRYRFLQGLTLPAGWLLATLLVKGKSWASYALPRDLSMIALTAMALWALLLLLLKWQRQKPPAEI